MEGKTRCKKCADRENELARQRRVQRCPSRTQDATDNSHEFETNPQIPTERKPGKQDRKTDRSQERKSVGLCRDCDEEVGGGSTIKCEAHNARAREYRKKHEAKKRTEAKEAKAEKES